ncbi:MAG: SLC13 family permease [Acidimicrobiia bacterium]|nr:SLC13 family permease [Acidimicrobiia bacterium]
MRYAFLGLGAPMSFDAWLTLAVIAIAIALMIREIVPPVVAMLGAAVVLLLADVIDTSEAFSGFSNPAPLTIAALYILAGAASKAGLMQPLVNATLGTGKTVRKGLARLLPPVAGASSVLNNTPIVAVMVPEIETWATRHGRSVSRYLMPLSFASILGGIVTLIGTSTNLVVSGLLAVQTGEELGFFEITKVGLPIALVGLAVLIVLSPRLLAQRRSTRDDLTDATRDFVVDMQVEPSGPLDGSTVDEAGLRHLAGVFLVQVIRSDETLSAIGPDFRLRSDDVLRFAGKADDVVDLQSIPGLLSRERDQFEGFDFARSSFFEAVVGASSPLVGRTLKEIKFRSTYQAAVVAVHRAGARIDAKLGEVPLRVGDTLVLLSDAGFRDRWRNRRDFLLVSPMADAAVPARHLRLPVALIMGGVVLLAATGALPIIKAALFGVLLVLGLRILTPGEARRAVDLDVVLLIAAGFGVAAALTSSGLAEQIGAGLVSWFGSFGTLGVLLSIVIATVVLTEAVSNTAAAVLVFPIAMEAAAATGLDLTAVAVAIAIAASASFLTPIGYQTNVMVYGPGGYRYTDYTRLGLPLTLIMIVGIVTGVALWWGI